MTQRHDYDDNPMFFVLENGFILVSICKSSAFENVDYGYTVESTNQVFSLVCSSQVRDASRLSLVSCT